MKKALVAYFSASGVTEQVAEKLASAAHADCFRIQPKIVYTKAHAAQLKCPTLHPAPRL